MTKGIFISQQRGKVKGKSSTTRVCTLNTASVMEENEWPEERSVSGGKMS